MCTHSYKYCFLCHEVQVKEKRRPERMSEAGNYCVHIMADREQPTVQLGDSYLCCQCFIDNVSETLHRAAHTFQTIDDIIASMDFTACGHNNCYLCSRCLAGFRGFITWYQAVLTIKGQKRLGEKMFLFLRAYQAYQKEKESANRELKLKAQIAS